MESSPQQQRETNPRPRTAPRENRQHVVILHEKLARRKSDRYIINLALAYREIGYKVSLITSHYNKKDAMQDINFEEQINVRHMAWWIPRSILGLFKSNMSFLKAVWMALRVAWYSPEQQPSLVVLDVNMVALCLLSFFTRYKLFYVATYEESSRFEACIEHSRFFPSLLQAKFIKLADEVIVETAAIAEIFKKSFPAVTKEPLVLYPAIDIGLWAEPCISIQRIIPDLLENTILFLSIGKYRRSSNFKLSLDAFELLLHLIDDSAITKRFQLVIAGNCKTVEEKFYYNELVQSAKERVCASQITFLKHCPTLHEKTLISESAIMIHPAKSDIASDFVLKAMHLGKPIIATNKGIASKILLNRISGITTEPEASAIAQVMKKLMMSPHLQVFMGDIAKDAFQKGYSFQAMCNKLCLILKKPIVQKNSNEVLLGEAVIESKVKTN